MGTYSYTDTSPGQRSVVKASCYVVKRQPLPKCKISTMDAFYRDHNNHILPVILSNGKN